MEDNPQEPYEYEVDLRDYISVLWDQKWLIIAIFVAAVVLAGAYSLNQPSVYETQATLMVTPRMSDRIDYEAQGTSIVLPKKSEQIVKGGGGFSSVSLPPMAYKRSALDSDLLDKIIKELGLKTEKGELISKSSLKDRLSLNIETKDQNGRTVRIVTLTAKGRKPDKITKITNKWAKLYRGRITELISSETARLFEFIQGRFQEVSRKLSSLEEERQKYREQNSLKVLKTQVSALNEQYNNFLSQLQGKRAELNSKKSQLSKLRSQYESYHPIESIKYEELKLQYQSLFSKLQDERRQLSRKKRHVAEIRKVLKTEPKFLEPEKSLSKEAIWGFLEEGVSKSQLKNLPGLKVTDQVKNDVYFSLRNDLQQGKITINTLQKDIPKLKGRVKELRQTLKQHKDQIKVSSDQRRSYNYSLWKKMNDLKIEVSTLKEEVSYLESKTEELSKKISRKQAKINRARLQINQLTRKIENLKDTYKTLSTNLEEARIAKEEKESSIRIMEQAVAPEKPLRTNTKQNVAVAGVLGLFIGVLVAFFRNYMEEYEEEEKEEEVQTEEGSDS